MREKIESLRVRLAERLDEAEQDAKYARASDEHAYHRTRAEELAWCYNEIVTLLYERDTSTKSDQQV